jgi:AcrR family transcriptional regulator
MPALPTAARIAAAAGQLLAKEGVEGVTMRRVAAAAGVTPMAVYRHYPNRAGLLDALADAGFEELAARLAAIHSSRALEKRMAKFLDVYLEHALANPHLFELMFLKSRQGARRFPEDFIAGRSPTANPMAALISQGMAAGYLRPDDVWEIVFEMGALLQGLLMLYLGGRTSLSPARFRAFCHRSFERYLHGIRK